MQPIIAAAEVYRCALLIDALLRRELDCPPIAEAAASVDIVISLSHGEAPFSEARAEDCPLLLDSSCSSSWLDEEQVDSGGEDELEVDVSGTGERVPGDKGVRGRAIALRDARFAARAAASAEPDTTTVGGVDGSSVGEREPPDRR